MPYQPVIHHINRGRATSALERERQERQAKERRMIRRIGPSLRLNDVAAMERLQH